jgi:hypothetical protein
MRQIKSFNVMQTAKVLGALYFVFGLGFSLFIVFISITAKKGPGKPSLVFAVLSPFFYGGAGFVFTALFCWFYNVIAKRLGGIEVEVVDSN